MRRQYLFLICFFIVSVLVVITLFNEHQTVPIVPTVPTVETTPTEKMPEEVEVPTMTPRETPVVESIDSFHQLIDDLVKKGFVVKEKVFEKPIENAAEFESWNDFVNGLENTKPQIVYADNSTKVFWFECSKLIAPEASIKMARLNLDTFKGILICYVYVQV